MNPMDPSQNQNDINPNQEQSPQNFETQPPVIQPDAQQPIAPVQPPQFPEQPIQPQQMQDQLIGQLGATPKNKKGLIIGLSIAGGVLVIGGVLLTLFLTGVFGGNSAHRASLIEKIRNSGSNSDMTLTCGEVRSIKDGNDFITLLKENNAEVREQFEQMGSMFAMVTPMVDAAIQYAKDSCQGKSDDAEADMNPFGSSDPDYDTDWDYDDDYDWDYDTGDGECIYTTESGGFGYSNMMTEEECYEKDGDWTPAEE